MNTRDSKNASKVQRKEVELGRKLTAEEKRGREAGALYNSLMGKGEHPQEEMPGRELTAEEKNGREIGALYNSVTGGRAGSH